VIEAVVDPFEPPLPPKITRDQAMKFARALTSGDPNRQRIALTVLSDRYASLFDLRGVVATQPHYSPSRRRPL
jgi:pyruvate dehydrogenase (quinone)